MSQKDHLCEREEPSTDTQSWFTSCQKMLQYSWLSFEMWIAWDFFKIHPSHCGSHHTFPQQISGKGVSLIFLTQVLRYVSLTCTGAHCKAHSPLGSVKDDIESFHDCSTNDQGVCGGGDAESVALQIISYHKDGLNIKLWKRKFKKNKNKNEFKKGSQSVKSNTSQQVEVQASSFL